MQVAGCRLQVAGYRLQVTGYRFWATPQVSLAQRVPWRSQVPWQSPCAAQTLQRPTKCRDHEESLLELRRNPIRAGVVALKKDVLVVGDVLDIEGELHG